MKALYCYKNADFESQKLKDMSKYCYDTQVFRTFYTSINEQRCLISSFVRIFFYKNNAKNLLSLLGKLQKIR